MEHRIQVTEGFSFDDVLLKPQYSEVVPADVSVATRFSRSITLNIPLVSSAMDTVTEAPMAIALAQLGGIGVIHKNMSIAAQAKEIARVKRFESGVVADPITLDADMTMADVRALMARHSFSSFPVVDKEGRVVGIVTSRDIWFDPADNAPVVDIMTKSVITASVSASNKEVADLMQKHKVKQIPLVDGGGHIKGMKTVKDLRSATDAPLATKDDDGRLRVAGAVGATGDYLERALALQEAGADAVSIDTAHGYTKRVIDAVKVLKSKLKVDVIAGNVATEDGAKALVDAGADAVKVGMGPGSICTTRIVSGCGVPQFTAVFDSVAGVKGKVPVIADGGIKYSGDIVKALGAGADSVMIGSLFAGTDEAPGERIFYQGRAYKSYRGMGSLGAMKEGSKDRYGQEGIAHEAKFVPEGVEARVPYRGNMASVAYQLVGGIRSGFGYCGAKDISALHKVAEFIKITNAGLKESHVHDVSVTSEAPNYQSQREDDKD
jgi:IMP dehydrogenase